MKGALDLPALKVAAVGVAGNGGRRGPEGRCKWRGNSTLELKGERRNAFAGKDGRPDAEISAQVGRLEKCVARSAAATPFQRRRAKRRWRDRRGV